MSQDFRSKMKCETPVTTCIWGRTAPEGDRFSWKIIPEGARSQRGGRQSPVPEEASAPRLSQRRQGPARARSSLQTLATHSQHRQNGTSKSVFETRVKPDPRGKRSPGEVQFSHRNCISTGKFLLAQTAGSGINTSEPAKRLQSIRS